MKKLFLFALIFVCSVSALVALAAEDTSPAIIPSVLPELSVPAPASEVVPASIDREMRIEKVRKTALAEINRRLANLEKVRAKINGSAVAADRKTELLALIEQAKTGLADLSSQLTAATDLLLARELSKKIYVDYRIYAVLLPKINTLYALAMQSNHLSNLRTKYFPLVQARIDTLRAKGKDVTTWEGSLASAVALVTMIEAKIKTLTDQALALKPADYPATSKQTIGSLRVGVKAVQAEIKKVRINNIKK
jgi:hypothetical protein